VHVGCLGADRKPRRDGWTVRRQLAGKVDTLWLRHLQVQFDPEHGTLAQLALDANLSSH
jgi:hypothetical protein